MFCRAYVKAIKKLIRFYRIYIICKNVAFGQR